MSAMIVAVRTLGRRRPGLRRDPRRAAAAAVAAVERHDAGGIRRQRARDARRRVPARHLPSDVPGHRLRVEDEPRHALRVAALHRLSDGRGDAEERAARRDVHDRAAGDEAARAGGQGQDRLPRAPRRVHRHRPQGPAGAVAEGSRRARVRDPQQVQQPVPRHPQADEGRGRGPGRDQVRGAAAARHAGRARRQGDRRLLHRRAARRARRARRLGPRALSRQGHLAAASSRACSS